MVELAADSEVGRGMNRRFAQIHADFGKAGKKVETRAEEYRIT